ncbi:hypothetical protein IEU95_09110 [Hoyosella rhizosphaerae]|uniref:Uncharacterized protein n=2 Tax=Hoyosella rhizosphaerae TaxID=1755582 RepID=A0A916U0P0_9ACTN|nr:hypothetical protein [Hoyosella rhizosphaerae]GGC54911.1 hypothetical protein GCM10011410_04120 [Hoyosella rhizosphaerae]
MVAAVSAANSQTVMASWGASIAVAAALIGLLIAQRRIAKRFGAPVHRVGYGLAALIALMAVPTLMPVAAYHWGYLTFLGAAFVVLGLRSRQQLTWIAGAVTVVVGSLTGSSILRDSIFGLREASAAFGASVSAQVLLGVGVLLLAAWSRGRDRHAIRPESFR